MAFAGISNSVASVLAAPEVCPQCHASARVKGGSCVGCLLKTGLDESRERSAESFDDVLDAIEVRDTDWRLGNYQILEEIGRGGMGVIYRARQRHSKRIVALKRVLSYHGDSRETLERFRREAEAAASLDHPNILPIYEVGEAEGLPFFTMKYATGGTLQQAARLLRESPRECVRLLAKITRAVAYAHREGILHRDLKPGNVLLDAHGEPMVTDFGLAKWIDANSDLTRSLAIFGTPGFIAPEQAHGDRSALTPAADVYSLGAILFDLLTGRPPFIGEHALAVIRQAAEKTAPKLRSLVKGADRDLETICAKCLEREAAARYRAAADLAEDLERWLEGRPIVARPVSLPIQSWRWAKRSPKLATTLAVCLVLAGAGLLGEFRRARLAAVVRQEEMARHSVTVVPFEDLDELSVSSAPAQEMTKILTGTLQQTSGLYLHPAIERDPSLLDPRTPEDWREIGHATQAQIILTGSIRQREGSQRVVLRTIDAATGTPLRTLIKEDDTLASDARQAAATVLHIFDQGKESAGREKNGSDGGTANASARSYYERGKEFLQRYNLADLNRAIDSLRRAVALDPNYAQAQAMLAGACQARAQTDPGAHWLIEADAALAAALRIAPLLPEAHRAQAGILRRRGHLRAALDPLLTAYELDPSDGRTTAMLGDAYNQAGRPDLSIGWYEKAMRRQLQPLFADTLGNAWMSLEAYEPAAQAYCAATVFRPDLPVGLLGLSEISLLQGDFPKARELCARARSDFGTNPQPLLMAALIEFLSRHYAQAQQYYREAMAGDAAGGVDFAGSVRYLSALGFMELHSGEHKKEAGALLRDARALDLKELEATPDNPRRWYSLAANDAALEETEEALAALRKAITLGWIDRRYLALDPRFDALRAHPRFQEILLHLTTRLEEMRRRQPGRQLGFNLNAP